MATTVVSKVTVPLFLAFLLSVGLSAEVQAQSYRDPAGRSAETTEPRSQRGETVGSLPDWAEPSSSSGRSRASDPFNVETNDLEDPPDDVESIPVDSHIIWLFGVGLLYGVYQVRKKNATAGDPGFSLRQ